MIAKSRSRIAPSISAMSVSSARLRAGIADAVPIELPHPKIDLAGMDDVVLHLQALGVCRDRLPGEVRMIDIGDLMHMKEFELRVIEVEELLPAMALHPGIAMLARRAATIARNIRAFGAGIGDDTFEPVPVRHEALPSRPGDLGRCKRLCIDDVIALQADRNAEIFQNLPMRLAAGKFVVRDHFLAARLQDL